MKDALKTLWAAWNKPRWSPFDIGAYAGLAVFFILLFPSIELEPVSLLLTFAALGLIYNLVAAAIEASKVEKLHRKEHSLLYLEQPDTVRTMLTFDDWYRLVKQGKIEVAKKYVHRNPYAGH